MPLGSTDPCRYGVTVVCEELYDGSHLQVILEPVVMERCCYKSAARVGVLVCDSVTGNANTSYELPVC
ncbi:uncharacterized protein N7483_012229 [Penicillium malachiteum]|uniref:uncharacterized protein n=1 Tax=Penicillium malachiteum TaxID=1324776 RepID=UPI002546DD66|nr:uncharacterized protein N7483_012229 [Penicillium malachiteum]KAJ5715048.1 hypothetical protein N7483_012229 [Penicillium malachiteum]